MNRRGFLSRLGIGAGIASLTQGAAGMAPRPALVSARAHCAAKATAPTFDVMHGVTTFMRIKCEKTIEGGVETWVTGLEETPIEEHPSFDELCEMSPFLFKRRESFRNANDSQTRNINTP